MADDTARAHPDFAGLEAKRHICRTLMGGTTAMREAYTLYLPREPEEHDKDYRARLERSFLYNGFRRTILNLTGRIFKKTVTVDADDQMLGWLNDVTNDGRDLVTFGINITHTGMSEGIAYIFVDYTQTHDVETRADELDLSPRPYMVEISPGDLYYWRYEETASGHELMEVRWRESYIDGYERKDQIRVWYSNGNWEVYREIDTEDAQSKTWVEWSSGQSGLPGIPIVAIYFGDRLCAMGGDPPLRDLAEVNVAHWQSSSDQRWVLHIARVPMLFIKGIQSQAGAPATVVVGVNRHVSALDPQADMKWIEHSGASINAGRQDLKDLEGQMAAMGIELLLPNRPGQMTATGHALNKTAEESTLQVIAKAVKRGLEEAIGWMYAWAKQDVDRVEIGMETDHEFLVLDGGELNVLANARAMRDISRRAYLEELRRRGIVIDTFDFDDDLKKLEGEEQFEKLSQSKGEAPSNRVASALPGEVDD